jgi:hypothetical protein
MKMVQKIYGPKKDEVSNLDHYNKMNFVVYIELHRSHSTVRIVESGKPCAIQVCAQRILVGNSFGKHPLRQPRRGKNNINMNHR